MSQKVNLKAYFERIGFAGSIAPTLATLETILALHPAAIPFENLNPLLGLPVSLELAAIEKKLLAERRGGYCYEHNLLLMAVLRELDYSVRGLAARVLWTNPDAVDGEAHHMLVLVEIAGSSYIADVGFGGMTPTAPLKLKREAEQATPHETYRLLGGDPLWRLEARIGEDWRPVYVFDTTEKSAADYAGSNAFLSTDPASSFRKELRLSLAPPGKRINLRDNRLTIHKKGEEPETRFLTSAEQLRETMADVFGLQLPPAAAMEPLYAAVLARAGIIEEPEEVAGLAAPR